MLREALTPVAENIEFAFVYGSFARGEENAGSDIDLMVIGEITLDDLLDRISPLEHKLNRPINPTVFAGKNSEPNSTWAIISLKPSRTLL